jgi:tetratricopeptide (TPR) repeat protein
MTAAHSRPAAASGTLRRRPLFFLAGVVLIGVALVACWRIRSAPAVRVVPPVPSDIQDPEVRRALEQARQRVVGAPEDARAWGFFGMVLLAHLFDLDADRCFAEAARLAPREPRWPHGRGVIALKRDPDNALFFLRQAAAVTDPLREDHSAYRLQLAETLLEQQQTEEAERLFQGEWRLRPGDPRTALGLGRIALARGDRPSARELLTIAQGSPFARKTATAQLAALAQAGGDRQAALECAKRAGELPEDAAWPDPLLDEVFSLQTGHRHFERTLAELERQHQFAEAAEMWLERVREHPTARALVGAGINLARLGDYERAIPLLRQAVALDPASVQAHYTIALAQFSRAEKEWLLAPGSVQGKEWFREVIEHARRAAELKPDHARAYLFWGLAWSYLGRPADAVLPLRQGVTCRPEVFELQLALGEALLEVGQEKEAQTHLANARRLDPKDPRPAQALQRARTKRPGQGLEGGWAESIP